MTNDFIKLKEKQYGDTLIVNINNITFYENAPIIYMNGVHGEGNGIFRIDNDSHKRLLNMVESRLWDD